MLSYFMSFGFSFTYSRKSAEKSQPQIRPKNIQHLLIDSMGTILLQISKTGLFFSRLVTCYSDNFRSYFCERTVLRIVIIHYNYYLL